MRVICIECGASGRINKTNRLSENVADLYCSCTVPECGHRWVATFSFKQTLIPAKSKISSFISSFILLSLEQKEALACELNNHLAELRHQEQQAK